MLSSDRGSSSWILIGVVFAAGLAGACNDRRIVPSAGSALDPDGVGDGAAPGEVTDGADDKPGFHLTDGSGNTDVGPVGCPSMRTCASAGANCGPVADGCGGILQCGTCALPDSCGGSGVPSICGHGGGGGPDGGMVCRPRTCAEAGAGCGPVADGCGGLVQCGMCMSPETCGGAGHASICGRPVSTNPGCVPRTCAAAGANCGPVSDGCGALLNCGTCEAPTTCGGGGEPSVCGGHSLCVPRSCKDLGANCGPAADGCGGLLDCGSCTMPEICGGGGVPSVCGSSQNTDGGPGCVPQTCIEVGASCGPAADGCGGLLNCGGCQAPATCGGGGTPSVCGGTGCLPRTCADLGASCGPAADGCGGLLDCGMCMSPEVCGGGGKASICGASGTADPGGGCMPRTCLELGAQCGPAADGCGGLIDCGMCMSPATCGGGGKASVCGGACVAKTCGSVGANCGPVADGCGGLLDCGMCNSPDICGGGGKASVCGGGNTVPTNTCVNLQCRQMVCPNNGKTTVSGTVYDPAGKVPLYNVTVYVNNAAVAAITTGATCDRCADALTGQPIAVTATDTQGHFVLENVPTGTNVPLVIQTGKWRRQIVLPSVTACTDNPITDVTQTRLPRNHTEGDIPRIALTTGGADPLECLLRKIGIEDSEFTPAGGAGRVHLYAGTGGTNKFATGTALTNATNLWNTKESLGMYDVVLLACEGGQNIGTKSVAARQALVDYTAVGGRVFASHWHNVWLQHGPTPWPDTAVWNFQQDLVSPVITKIDQSFPKGQALADWLVNVGGSTTKGDLSVKGAQHTIDSVDTSLVQRWIYADNVKDKDKKTVSAVQYFAFNTPIDAASSDMQCGRVVLSDIHVSSGDKVNTSFPNGCVTSDLSPQEKALEFMLFDITSRVCDDKMPPEPPKCSARTCQDAGASCGPVGDGCGKVLDCGTCTLPETCGGGGVASVCGKPTCAATTCLAAGANCGSIGDGCGKVLTCGMCTAPDSCGGGGTANVCGHPSCTKRTCADAKANCGPVGDGCGGLLDCGMCMLPDTCGGGGVASVCGHPACTPRTCVDAKASCGPAGDGCGGVIDCGKCTLPDTCGGGGKSNVCGHPVCTPRTCAAAGASCGQVGDGCGGLLDCGKCTAPDTCGGGGVSSVCGHATCTPRTCAAAGANCGAIGDGCGGVLDCGVCMEPDMCGGGGKANVCGSQPCVPRTCTAAGANCGPVGDGCGGVLDCGKCTLPDTCGGNGTPSVCGHPACVPRTCAAAGANCGPVGDGCGGIVDCGLCTYPDTCGGNGMPSVCGHKVIE
jgi:hypothetical protein